MKKFTYIVTLSTLVFFVGGCGTKVVQQKQQDELLYAPSWVKQSKYEQGKIVKKGVSATNGTDFRIKRDEALADAKIKISALLEKRLKKLFSRIDPDSKYTSITDNSTEKILKNSLELVKMEKLFETPQSATVYLQATLSINALEESVESYFIQNLQKYNYLFKNFTVLKNSGDLHVILTSE